MRLRSSSVALIPEADGAYLRVSYDPSWALVSRPLDIPSGSGVKTSTKSGEKVTVSCTEFVDGNTLAQTYRFDILYQATTVDQRLGARLTS